MRKRWFNVVLSVLLILICLFSDFSMMLVHAESNATARQKAYIDFASSRMSVTEAELNSLTKDEMRILGVFLSNFYVPWSTQLVQTDDDDSTREQMVEILTETLSFDETLARDIVDAVFQLSISTAQKLSVRVVYDWYYGSFDSDGNWNKDDEPSFEHGIVRELSYYDLLSFFEGDCCPDLYLEKIGTSYEGSANKSDIDYDTDFDDREDYAYMDYLRMELITPDGKVVFVIDDDYDADEAMLAACLRNVPMDRGIGYNVFATSNDIETRYSGNETIGAIIDSLRSIDYAYNISILGWGIYVDCFGNLIVDTGVGRQYVLMPGCMNPYVWRKDGYNCGECLPMNNLAIMSLSTELSEDGVQKVRYYQDEYGEDIILNLSSDNEDLSSVRILRGVTDTTFQSAWGRFTDIFGTSNSETVSKILLDVYNDSGHIFTFTNDESSLENIWAGAYIKYALRGIDGFDTGRALDLLFGYEDKYSFDWDETIQDFILFDTLNAFSSDTPMVANQYGIFGSASYEPLLTQDKLANSFNNYLFDAKNNTLVSLSTDDQKKLVAGIYCAYVFAYFETQGTDEGGHVNFRFCGDNLPDIGSGTIELTDTSLIDMQEKVLVMSYNLLHPEEGVAYVAKLATSKLEGILLKWHSDLVGNVNTGSTTGATKYVGASSYMTTPDISDVGWLNSLFSLYTSNIAYILMFILIVMLIYAISGYIGWQRAVVNTLCFGFCIYALPMLVSGGISLANSFTDSLYNDKFTYWAIVQHEAYQEDLENAIAEEDYADYMVTLFRNQGFKYDSHVVNLRWMCPKKDNYLVNIEKEIYESTNSSSITKLTRGVLNNQLSGEDYTDSANKTYLYRSYTDIASYAQYIYRNIGVRGSQQVNGLDTLSTIKGYDGSTSLQDYFVGYTTASGLVYNGTPISGSLDNAERLGFNFNTGLGETAGSSNRRFYYFNRSSGIADAINTDLNSVDSGYNALGVPTSEFNFTLANFNSGVRLSPEQASLGVFAVYSESPYYYFNWNIRDQLEMSTNNSTYPVKDLLLSNRGGLNTYFFNTSSDLKDTDSYGQLRDYMDMRSLFSVVIPYLKACNDYVIAFDDVYELRMIGDYEVRYDTDINGNMTLAIPSELRTLTDDNKDAYYSYWHDVQVANLFNMYTPWVDSLYSCSYAKSETIEVAGRSYVIEDPLNPASYPEERPMIFSESERLYYGLTLADLTEVERKILSLNEKCYNELIYIMNYYTFDTEVLVSALAMSETFEFNKEFSETPLVGDSNVLYPQGFELKNFSFDAYFRLILSETTGLDLNSSISIYESIVSNTSVFTAILILLCDLTAVWFVPFLRLAIVVLLFVMCVITVLSSCVTNKSGDNLDFKAVVGNIGKSVVSPLMKFLFTTIICAWIVSLFVSSGYTGVTGKLDYTISFGDPILAMWAILVVNCVLIYVYVVLVLQLFKDGKSQVKGIVNSASQVGAGLMALGTGAILGKTAESGGQNITAPVGGGAGRQLSPRLQPKSAQDKLASKELADRRKRALGNAVDKVKEGANNVASSVKDGANKVKDTLTAPARRAQEQRDAEAKAEQDRLNAEKAKQAREKAEAEAQAKKDAEMRKQAEYNAKAMIEEQERRESERAAKIAAEKAERKAKNEEIRRNNINKGMQEVKKKQEKSASQGSGSKNNGKSKSKSGKSRSNRSKASSSSKPSPSGGSGSSKK